jgi:hypothetical protein
MTRAGAILLLVVVGATACGGGGSSPDRRGAFVRAANAVCATASQRIAALPPVTDDSGVVSRLQSLAGIARDEAQALQPLPASPADAPHLGDLVAQLELVTANTAAAATATQRHDATGAASALSRARAANANSNNVARALGLTSCGGALISTVGP